MYWPVWFCGDMETCFTSLRVAKVLFFPVTLNYEKAVLKFTGGRLWITEFWTSPTDPDWGCPGKEREIIATYLRHWGDRVSGFFLWEGPSFWRKYEDLVAKGAQWLR